MSVRYQAVNWNRQKRIYDTVVVTGSLLVFLAFGGFSLARPDANLFTALIRGLGVLALLLLHVILGIGPLARLDRRFLPLLYNRRHLGVTMAVVALAHAVLVLQYYHGSGDLNPVASLLQDAPDIRLPSEFPFELLGLAALAIILLLAVTSHDFWLSVLTPPVWKTLHMSVYPAYGLLVLHVSLGIAQAEPGTVREGLLAAGVVILVGLHVAAGLREWRRDRDRTAAPDGWVDLGPVAAIPEGRALAARVGRDRVAVFRYDGKVSCVSGVCRHQNGPLAEGRIVEGCITCPWHGYQYYPDSGISPPPDHDTIATYRVRVRHHRVLVHRTPNPPGTLVEPGRIA